MTVTTEATTLGVYARGYCISFDRKSKHSPARLWRAITDSVELTRWMAYPMTVDLRVGGGYHADFGRTGGGQLNGVIVKVESERVLRYAWGSSTVEWKIEPDGAGSRFTFAQHGLFPREIPGEEGAAAGWHAWLEDLDLFLETGAPSSEAHGEKRWYELQPGYRAALEAVVLLEPAGELE